MLLLVGLASFEGRHFMTGIWAFAGQHPISIKPAYQHYYDLFSTWGVPVICSVAEYDAALRSIEELADA